MYYVSGYNSKTRRYGITDTSDGVTDWLTEAFIRRELSGFEIQGVTLDGIRVVNAAAKVVQTKFDAFDGVVRSAVAAMTEETCMELARSAHFVKKIKGLPVDEMKRVVCENIYPDSVREAVMMAREFSNSVQEVDVRDRDAVLDSLRTKVCVVLQQKTNGVLTSFMCTGSLALMDDIYAPMFFDSVYLTKQLYGYTVNMDRLRPRRDTSDREKNPSMLNVFSCALRFRQEGKNHDGVNKELSSPFYTVNLDRLLGMYVLNDVHGVGDRIVPEFKALGDKSGYNFDFRMWKEVRSCLASGQNYFKNEKVFMQFVDTDTLSHVVELNEVISRFDDDFSYMAFLRKRGYSFG